MSNNNSNKSKGSKTTKPNNFPKTGKNNRKGNANSNRTKKTGQQNDVMGTPYGSDSAATSRSNPVDFYKKFDQFVTDAARLPFARPVGSSILINGQPYSTPGVMRIRFTPAIGVSNNFNSAINRASVRFYTYLRSNQKASATYDHQDVTMMEVAMDSAYMFHALLRRVYGIVNLFTPANEYYSRAVVAACGCDFNDIQHNLQDFRAYINAFAYQLGQYALPASLTWFDRHQWMCEGLYTDGRSTKSQTYIFVPDRFYIYDNTVETGSQCTSKRWLNTGDSPTAHTFAEIKQFGDALINAISNDEDFAIISGDIYNFYGGDTYTLPYVKEDYAILPSYDEVVLSQIENCVNVGEVFNDTISQNPSVNQGAIIYQPHIGRNEAVGDSVFMNMHHDSPTPDEIIEATRLMVREKVATGTDYNEVLSCGTEMVTGIDVFTRDAVTRDFVFTHLDTFTTTITAENVHQLVTEITMLAQFDWAPVLHVYTADKGLCGITWDVENLDTVPGEYLQNIHLGCLLSLFEVGNNKQ